MYNIMYMYVQKTGRQLSMAETLTNLQVNYNDASAMQASSIAHSEMLA